MMIETEGYNEPLWDEDAVTAVTEEMLSQLDNILNQRHLTGADMLAALAKLSAAHIHSIQELVNGPEEKDAVESAYYKILDHYLAAFDTKDMLNEVEEMKREKMN